MSTSLLSTAPRTFSGSRDDEGHRSFSVTHLVEDNYVGGVAGPFTVLNTPGLPQIGSTWNFGTDNDIWAFCTPKADVRIHMEKEGDTPLIWGVTQDFTTNPAKRCQDNDVEDPLLEPDRIRGSFAKYTQEVTKDRQGRPIKNSSHEIIYGPQVEFDFNRATVSIQQNVADLELDMFLAMIDTVNDDTLWGLGPRKVKLSNAPWSREYKGSCEVYYTRTFEFDIDFKTFDKDPLDEGTKVLMGEWVKTDAEMNNSVRISEPDPKSLWMLKEIGETGNPPDADNPQHFMQYQDVHGNPARVLLNGRGEPYSGKVFTGGTGSGTWDDYLRQPFQVNANGMISRHVEYYPESNFLLLGIPTLL